MSVVSIGRSKTKRQTGTKARRENAPSSKACVKKNAEVREKETTEITTTVTAKEARDEVEGLIRREAGAMTRAIIDAVKKGELGQVKYLFEVGGIHPAEKNTVESDGRESVTARLLRRLDEQKEAAANRSDQSAGDGIARDCDAIE